MALRLAETSLERVALRSLLCEKAIRGKHEQQLFKTAIMRCNARLQNGSKIKIGFWPSEKSSLIQCADAVAYVAARSLRQNALTPELQVLWQCVQSRTQTSCRVLQGWND